MVANDSRAKDMSFAGALQEPPTDHVCIPEQVMPGPRAYAMNTEGNCLEPEYYAGDTVICDPDQPPSAGDFVAVWWKGGERQPQIKRLVFGLPEQRLWDMRGDGQFMLTVEQLNPPKDLWAPLCKVEAVHKVIHRIPAQGARHG